MTRKDYINIAGAIQATQARIKNNPQSSIYTSRDDQLRGVRRTAAHLAEFLADDNPQGFNPQLFLINCGYGASPHTLDQQDANRVAMSDLLDRGDSCDDREPTWS